MRRTACLAGLFATGAGVLAGGVPAFADSADNDGVNVLDGNNVSLVPIQLCGNNIPVIGLVLPILSPQANACTNAPVVDHPAESAKPNGPCENAGSGGKDKPGNTGTAACDPGATSPDPRPVARDPRPVGRDVAAALPTAPKPVAVRGHHAVTG